MIRGFVLCLLVGSSYASFGTASCSSGFSLVPFCATATCTSTEKSYSKPMPATYAWGEDTDLPIDTATNAAALRVLRWKCSCDKYDDGTAADGDCTFQQYKLNTNGTTSTSETEFIQALGYYKFNVWAPPPRSGRNESATQARIYDLWSDHQATRAADMQDATTEYRAQMKKKAKLRRSLTLLQESSKSKSAPGQNEPSPRLKESSKAGNPGAGAFYLKNKASGRCVHTEAGSAQNGGKLVYWDGCSGDKNKFEKVDTGDGDNSFYLKNKASGRCVHTEAGSAQNGGKLVYWDGCSGDKNKFEKVVVVVGKCWSGTCEQRASNTFKIGECSNGDVEAPGNCPDGTYQSPGISDQTPGTSNVYIQRIRPGNFKDFRNGDDNPQNHNGGGGMVDFACPGNSGHTDAQEQYCMDWSIPSGCDMLDFEQIKNGHIDVEARFQELAAELVPGCNPSVTVKQFWSTTGIPYNGEQAKWINEYQIPFSQKYNAYYVATWLSGSEGSGALINRFWNAIQILTCEDESVSSQVFAEPCDDGYDYGCSGDLTCAVVDSIWRKIVGEIHRKILLG